MALIVGWCRHYDAHPCAPLVGHGMKREQRLAQPPRTAGPEVLERRGGAVVDRLPRHGDERRECPVPVDHPGAPTIGSVGDGLWPAGRNERRPLLSSGWRHRESVRL